MPPSVCPNCGATIPPKARACPECGSDDQTGWSTDANVGGLDLPDDNFDYADYLKKEFGEKSPKPRGISWLWWLVALGLVMVFLLFYLR